MKDGTCAKINLRTPTGPEGSIGKFDLPCAARILSGATCCYIAENNIQVRVRPGSTIKVITRLEDWKIRKLEN